MRCQGPFSDEGAIKRGMVCLGGAVVAVCPLAGVRWQALCMGLPLNTELLAKSCSLRVGGSRGRQRGQQRCAIATDRRNKCTWNSARFYSLSAAGEGFQKTRTYLRVSMCVSRPAGPLDHTPVSVMQGAGAWGICSCTMLVRRWHLPRISTQVNC